MIDMTTKLYTTIELLDRKSQNIEFQLYFLILSHTPISYYNTYAIPMMKSGNIFFLHTGQNSHLPLNSHLLEAAKSY